MRHAEEKKPLHAVRMHARPSRKRRGCQGSQLVEFALMLPLLVVMVVGVMDFGSAYTLKQKLNNAAREGARFAAEESCLDCDAISPAATTKAIENVIVKYLIQANVSTCGLSGNDAPTSYSITQATYTFTSSNCGTTSQPFVITIKRMYSFTNSNGATVLAARVLLQYPYGWTFSKVIGLLSPGASYAGVSTIISDAMVENES
jgi:Flp pilus assembly protein TadG